MNNNDIAAEVRHHNESFLISVLASACSSNARAFARMLSGGTGTPANSHNLLPDYVPGKSKVTVDSKQIASLPVLADTEGCRGVSIALSKVLAKATPTGALQDEVEVEVGDIVFHVVIIGYQLDADHCFHEVRSPLELSELSLSEVQGLGRHVVITPRIKEQQVAVA